MKLFSRTSKKSPDEKDDKKKIINPRYLFYGFLSLLLGLTLARKLFAGELSYIIITIVLLASAILLLSLTKRFKMLIVIIALFFAGSGLFFAGQSAFQGNTYLGTNAVTGRVSDQMTQSDTSWTIKLDNVKINGKSERNMILYVYDSGHTLDIQAGDMVAFEGEIENARMFDLGNFNNYFYRKDAPYTSSANAEDIILSPQAAGLRYDEVIRAKTKSLLYQNMSQKNADICFAVLFGDKSGVDLQTRTNYNEIGIIHILTVSGLHVGFLVTLLYFLFKKCNKYVKFCLIFAILLLYNILCGFSPAVMRASIMALIMLLAKLCKRQYDGLSALALAGFVIVLFRPLTALDVGFLMSFFSVMSIILLYKPIFRVFFKFLPKFAAKSIALTLSAQIGIVPFAASMFSRISILSIFANMFIIPIFSVLFPLLFVLFVLGLAMPFLGPLLHIVDWGFVAINYIAALFASSDLKINLKPYPIAFAILFAFFMFAISGLLMIERVWKIFLSSWLVLAVAAGLVVFNFVGNGKNFMMYLDTSPQSVVYATNSSGESLLVCQQLSSDSAAQFAHVLNIKSVDYIITLDDMLDKDITDLLQPKAVAFPSALNFEDKTYAISPGQKLQLGDYSFNFEYIGANLTGISFKIDKFENFFATNDYLSYNTKEELSHFLSTSNYDFCFLNTFDGRPDCDSIILSTYSNGFSKYVVKRFGNTRIDLQGQTKLRCID